MSLANKISTYNRKRKFDFFTKTVKPSQSQFIFEVGFTSDDYSAEANYFWQYYQ